MTNSKNTPKPGTITAAFDPARLDLNPVQPSELVKIGDRLGVFTPIAAGEDTASQGNLEKVVDVLRKRVAALEGENLALRAQLADIEAERTRTPDDFSSAVAHTLDTLQLRLADMKNPVSRFAVRDISIDAQVFMDVNRLGTLEYRFVKPGDVVDSARLSTIHLDMVPLPREEGGGSLGSPAFTPFLGVEEIQGIGKTYGAKLNQHQIYTVSDLLAAGTRVRSTVELATLLEIDRAKLGEWIGQAELVTVKDIDGRAAEVLHRAGIVGLAALAAESADSLVERYNQSLARIKRTSLKPITSDTAARWIAAAKQFVGKRDTT